VTVVGEIGETSDAVAAQRRWVTFGLILLVTLAAFEDMGVGTALPTIVTDLHGQQLYSWPFTALLGAQVVGTVIGGRVSDRIGPAAVLWVAPLMFLLGLVIAGTAGGMPALLAGRVLQGFGGGSQIVAIYVLIAVVFPERDRPAVIGSMSAAWVVPSLVGPAVAGLLAQYLSWRWVFLGLAPFVLLGWLALVPMVRRMPAHHRPAGPSRRGMAAAAVVGALGMSAVTWAAEHPSGLTLVLGGAGLALLVPALWRLLPRGTMLARPGLPVVILSRGLLAGAFFGAEAYLPLTLTQVHGFTPALAGLPLTVGSVGWSVAAWWQGRHPELSRPVLIRIGFLLIAAAMVVVAFLGPALGPSWLALPGWTLAGVGMGFGISGVAVLLLELSGKDDRGFNSAALQLSDMFGQSVSIGFGGVLIAALGSFVAVIPLDLALSGLAVLGALLISRAARDS